MNHFIDTSALYAVLDAIDANHKSAKPEWYRYLDDCALLAASRRKVSLVDCMSFEVMRRYGIRSAFAFDPHFSEQDFLLIPSPTAE